MVCSLVLGVGARARSGSGLTLGEGIARRRGGKAGKAEEAGKGSCGSGGSAGRVGATHSGWVVCAGTGSRGESARMRPNLGLGDGIPSGFPGSLFSLQPKMSSARCAGSGSGFTRIESSGLCAPCALCGGNNGGVRPVPLGDSGVVATNTRRGSSGRWRGGGRRIARLGRECGHRLVG